MSGKLFVIEGLDGSGKQTQSELIYERLKKENYDIIRVEYPNYKSESSSLVKMYLRGDFGENADDVSAYIASTFYAADRYASYKTEYQSFYENGGIVLADRYTTSNMVHQASKIHDAEQRRKYLDWLCDLEFSIYGIPVPTQVFFLDIDPADAMMLMRGRDNKFTHTGEKDIHEKSESHLRNSYQTAKYLISRYGWESVPCIENGAILPIEIIHEKLYNKIKKYL